MAQLRRLPGQLPDHRGHLAQPSSDLHPGHPGRRATAAAESQPAAVDRADPFGALFAWVTRDARLLERLPPAEVIRAARLRFMVGLVVYAVAFALSWVSAPLAVALCGLMALYSPSTTPRCPLWWSQVTGSPPDARPSRRRAARRRPPTTPRTRGPRPGRRTMLAPVRHQPPPPWPANTPLGPNAAQILATEHWSLLAALLADAIGFGPQTTTLAWCCCRWCCCWASPPTRGWCRSTPRSSSWCWP